MITASTLLSALPNLSPAAKEVLGKLGNAELHIPGFPSIPNLPGALPPAVQQALVAALGSFSVELYQTVGVRVSKDGQPLGSVGVKITEGLTAAGPVGVTVTPVLELGQPKA